MRLDFNPEMLRLAREVRGKTQSDLVDKTDIPQGNISKYEHGLRIPEDTDIQTLSKELDFPYSFFFQKEHDLPSGMIFHRKRSRLKKGDRLMIEAESKLRIKGLKKLMENLDIDSDIPKFDLNDFHNDPAEIATVLRNYWKVSRGPIKNLVNLLENKGIIIIKFDFGNNLLDGFFLVDDLTCIILNSRFSADRQRFTLAHELGHIIMHSVPNVEAEDEANEFASEFLMPAEDIDDCFRIGKIDLKKLASLKPIWRVSMGALLTRAHRLKYITSSNARRMWTLMNKYGYRKREPISIDEEQPTLLKEIISEYKNTMGYSDEELMKLLHLNNSDYHNFFNALSLRIFK